MIFFSFTITLLLLTPNEKKYTLPGNILPLIVRYLIGGNNLTEHEFHGNISISHILNAKSNPNNVAHFSKKQIKFFLYPIQDFRSMKQCQTENLIPQHPKHAHITFAYQAMHKHPWRTENISLAQIAVLLMPFDALSRGKCTVQFSEMIVDMTSVLKMSPIFPKVRHVVIANDFMSSPYHGEIIKKLLPSGILVGMEGRGECRTSLGYTSNYASFGISIPHILKKPHERKYSVNMIGQVDTRWGYRDRRVLFESNGSIPGSYIAVSDAYGIFNKNTFAKQNKQNLNFRNHVRKCRLETDRDRCVVVKPSILDRRKVVEVMQNSNFTLCLRGDTLGSDRWINAMVSGTALLAVGDSITDLDWLPFPDAVPWKEIVLLIPRAEFHRDPVGCLRKIMQDMPVTRLRELQKLSRYYADDLEWSSPHSRVVSNLIRETMSISCNRHTNYLKTNY